VDVFVAGTADAAPRSWQQLADDDTDGKLEVQLTSLPRPYFRLKSPDGSEAWVAERLLPLEGGSNFRDVGGYPAAKGRHVRWGKIFRSGGMPLLTAADYQYLSSIGIDTLCDLRSREEQEIAPTDPTALHVKTFEGPSYDGEKVFGRLNDANGQHSGQSTLYRSFPTLLQPHLRKIFASLLAGDVPLLYNCSAGQDRTGFVTAMVFSALGVPRDVIYADYHLSTTFRKTENEIVKANVDRYAETNMVAKFYQQALAKAGQTSLKPKPLLNDAGAPLLAEAFDEVDKRWGSVDAYLQDVGIGPVEKLRLRSAYLE